MIRSHTGCILVLIAVFTGSATARGSSNPPRGVLDLVNTIAGGPAQFDYAWICHVGADPQSVEAAIARLVRSADQRYDWNRLAEELQAGLEPLPHHRKSSPWIRSTTTRRKVYIALAARAVDQGDAAAARILFVLGGVDFAAYPRQAWAERVADKTFRSLLGLPAEQEREVGRLADQLLRSSSDFMTSFRKIVGSVEELISHDGPLPQKKFAGFLGDFERAWVGQNDNPTAQETLATLYWRVCCLVRHKAEDERLSEARALASRLSNQTPDAIARGWIEQAAAADGPKPENSGVTVIRSPNDLKQNP